ncbi:histidine-containing phosphotransfer protein 2-like isoform X3 [Olea europaea var. sylvestris]|uniref:Histidine-containing phosphotransfer protein n=1 Tax=Olea europaea subsp. europaea TaxID=158383 RepID=A0A8S0SAN4_OLEEU|nr:histidine-containing phosphotransfer protein 2-like isoform X3 [Olea europaea var. sylvestris]CAA2989362.1 histidine-containing phosphotransfer 1-like isoform X1 [Olea europaea subsp. europaea]
MDYKNLDTKSLNQLLINSIGELQQQGLVDDYFRHCHSLKEENGPFFFVELIPVFLADARKVVNEMAKAIDQSLVDYNQMYVHCIKLKGSAACIGACRLRNACTYMSQAIDDKSRDRCCLALNDIKQEYKYLQNPLESIVKLEQEIVSREASKS